jgi:hypothetical protein
MVGQKLAARRVWSGVWAVEVGGSGGRARGQGTGRPWLESSDNQTVRATGRMVLP